MWQDHEISEMLRRTRHQGVEKEMGDANVAGDSNDGPQCAQSRINGWLSQQMQQPFFVGNAILARPTPPPSLRGLGGIPPTPRLMKRRSCSSIFSDIEFAHRRESNRGYLHRYEHRGGYAHKNDFPARKSQRYDHHARYSHREGHNTRDSPSRGHYAGYSHKYVHHMPPEAFRAKPKPNKQDRVRIPQTAEVPVTRGHGAGNAASDPTFSRMPSFHEPVPDSPPPPPPAPPLPPPFNSIKAWCKAVETFKANRLLEAVLGFYEIINKDAGVPEGLLYYNSGIAFAKMKKLSLAIGAFEAAVHFNPTLAVAWHRLGVSLARQGDLGAAKTALERTLSLFPGAREGNETIDYRPLGMQYALQKAAVSFDHQLCGGPFLHYEEIQMFRLDLLFEAPAEESTPAEQPAPTEKPAPHQSRREKFKDKLRSFRCRFAESLVIE